MSPPMIARRQFLTGAGALGGLGLLHCPYSRSGADAAAPLEAPHQAAADYTLRIQTSPIEIAPKRIISATTYNDQFPGPLLRFKEGRQVTVDIYNDTNTAEQLHYHGQKVSVDVD